MENRIIHVRKISIFMGCVFSSYWDNYYSVEVETYNGIKTMFLAFRHEYLSDIDVYVFYDEYNEPAHLFTTDSIYIEG